MTTGGSFDFHIANKSRMFVYFLTCLKEIRCCQYFHRRVFRQGVKSQNQHKTFCEEASRCTFGEVGFLVDTLQMTALSHPTSQVVAQAAISI